jgi:hypothetical protein
MFFHMTLYLGLGFIQCPHPNVRLVLVVYGRNNCDRSGLNRLNMSMAHLPIGGHENPALRVTELDYLRVLHVIQWFTAIVLEVITKAFHGPADIRQRSRVLICSECGF